MKPADLLECACRKYPKKVALRSGEKSVTYESLAQNVRRLTRAMVQNGVGPHDDVVISCGNSIEYIEMFLAASYVGAVPNLYNVGWSVEVALDLAREPLAKTKLAFLHVHDVRSGLIASRLHEEDAVPVVSLGESVPGCWEYEDFLAGGDSTLELEPFRFQGDDTVLQAFTSGTTSVPKCVMVTADNVTAWLLTTIADERWAHDDTMLITFPFFHVAGLCFLKAIAMGAQVVVGSSLQAKDIAEAIARYRVTRCGFAPILLDRLTAYASGHDVDFSSVRSVGYGSSHISVDLMKRCKTYLNCDLRQAYGMTETLTTGTSLTAEDHAVPNLLDSVGKPMLGIDVRVVDEAGRDCPSGIVGEVLIRSATVMKGYRGNPSLTNEVLADGWYHTKDMGFLDDEGHLRIRGRKDGMIISGGENIFPEEVADCIKRMQPDVIDAAVIGMSDAMWGQTPAAFVVRAQNSSINESDVAQFCADHLARYKKPRHVFFVEALPRGESGKVSTKELFSLYRQNV